ncbi:MAG: hypothetical protein RIB45_01475 [Marivibrio sp.]|uniref:hypothetical protein n=1 Tax=Marivibrio sp. TaxID=2039719 RepID=UPI0032EE7EB1
MTAQIPPGGAGGGDAAAAKQTGGRALSLTPHLIRQFAAGGAMQGRVTATGGEGRLQIATPHGMLTLQTGSALPPGTPVTLQMTSLGPPAQLAITPQAPSGQPAAQAPLGGQTLSATLAAPPGPPPAGQQAAQPAGRHAAPAAQAQTGASAPAPGASGASVLTTLSVGATLQGAVTAAGAQALQPGAPAPTPAALQAALAGGQPLPQGAGLSLKLIALTPQGQTPPPPASLSATSPLLSGVVTGQSTAGQTLVATSAGTIALNTGAGAPPAGTQLSLELAGPPRPPGPGVSAPFLGANAPGRFAGLDEALALLGRLSAGGGEGASPQAAAGQQALQSLQAMIPQPGAQSGVQMGTAMLFFLSALRGGGFERLVGETRAQSIERLQRGLGERLEGDLRGAAASRARDSGGGEWRAYSLPLLNDGELERIRLYLRDRKEAEGEEAGDAPQAKATRFVVEAHFSRLGPFQFDGLVREKTLDLMVRTQKPLEAADREAMRGLFADQISALGYGGSIAFQQVKAFDLHLAEDAAGDSGGVTV